MRPPKYRLMLYERVWMALREWPEGRTVRQLAGHMDLTYSQVSSSMHRLVLNGVVQRNAAEARDRAKYRYFAVIPD